MPVERQLFVDKRTTYDFVDRVMAADVFADNQGFASGAENPGGMDSSGAREVGLMLSQQFGKREKRFDSNPESRRRDRRETLSNRVDTFFAAQSAAAGNCPEAWRKLGLVLINRCGPSRAGTTSSRR